MERYRTGVNATQPSLEERLQVNCGSILSDTVKDGTHVPVKPAESRILLTIEIWLDEVSRILPYLAVRSASAMRP